jgi:hypothetical protein
VHWQYGGGRISKDGEGYTDYLIQVREALKQLKNECKELNIDIKKLPTLLERPHASLVKFIDEYYWLTVTRNCSPASIIERVKNSS